jgi:hypothetical protein
MFFDDEQPADGGMTDGGMPADDTAGTEEKEGGEAM